MGILSAILATGFAAIETINVKNIMKRLTTNEYLIYRTILSLPFVLIIVYLSGIITIDFSKYYILILILLLTIIGDILYFFSLSRLNAIIHNMIRRTYMILNVIILYFTGIEKINRYHFLGIVIVFLGLYLGVNIKQVDKSKKNDKLGLIVCIISVFTASITSILTKYSLDKSIISPSGLVILSIIGIIIYSIYLLVTKKSSMKLFKTSSKEVLLVSAYPPLIQFLMAYSYKYAGVPITNSIKSLATIPMYIYNIINGVEKFSIRKTLGLSLCIIGTVLVVIG